MIEDTADVGSRSNHTVENKTDEEDTKISSSLKQDSQESVLDDKMNDLEDAKDSKTSSNEENGDKKSKAMNNDEGSNYSLDEMIIQNEMMAESTNIESSGKPDLQTNNQERSRI